MIVDIPVITTCYTVIWFLHSSAKIYMYYLEEITEHFSPIGMESDPRLVNFAREENPQESEVIILLWK